MAELVEQPTDKPTRKVGNSGLSGAVVVILTWLGTTFGVDIPPEVASAITVIVMFVVGWAVKERVKTEVVK